MASYRLTRAAEAAVARISAQSEREFGAVARERYATLLIVAMRDVAPDPDRPGVREETMASRRLRTYHRSRSKGRVPAETGRVAAPRYALVFEIEDDGTVVIVGVTHERMQRAAALRRYARERNS